MFRPNQHRALILDAKRQRGSPANKPVLPMRLIAGIIKLVLSASIFSLTFSGKIIILSPSQNKKTCQFQHGSRISLLLIPCIVLINKEQGRLANRPLGVREQRVCTGYPAPGGTTGSFSKPGLLQELPRDNQLHNLVGAFVDLGDLGVPHHALERILGHVSVAPRDLERIRRHPHGHV